MFCRKCGKQIRDDSQFCPSCGTSVNDSVSQQAPQPQQSYTQQPTYHQQQYTYQPPQLSPTQCVTNVVSTLKISGSLWIVMASLQMLLAIYQIFNLSGIGSYYQDDFWLINGIVVLGMSVWNLIFGIKRVQLSQQYNVRPVGIVGTFEPIGGNVVY